MIRNVTPSNPLKLFKCLQIFQGQFQSFYQYIQLYLNLTEDKAKRASELLSKIALVKNLMQHECRSDIPEYYIKSIKQLVNSDDEFRSGFYKIMCALGSKYLDKYKSTLNDL